MRTNYLRLLLLAVIVANGLHTAKSQITYPYSFVYNGNPLARQHGAADPDVHIWGDTVWMYTSKDHDGIPSGYSNMDGYHAWSSTDMINWTDYGDVFNSTMLDTTKWGKTPPHWMWAPGAARKMQDSVWTYYLYYPHNVSFTDKEDWVTGVATAPNPWGPFTDKGPVKGPNNSGIDMDPMVFQDDDGQFYIYGNTLRVAKLNPDMLTIAEEPKWIGFVQSSLPSNWAEVDFGEGSYMHKKDGIYYYSWSNDGGQYTMGTNPYGPFTWGGTVRDKPSGSQDHHSIINFKGEWYYVYHITTSDYPPVKDGQSRIASYDRLFYSKDGKMQKVVPTLGPTNKLYTAASNGTIILAPPGGAYAPGTNVKLTMVSDLGFAFDTWNGDLSGSTNPVTVKMDSNISVSAGFKVTPIYSLTVNSANGIVTINPAGAGGQYNAGTIVSLIALKDFGYKFNGWSGDLVSEPNDTAQLLMNSDKNITANFVYEPGSGKIAFATNCGGLSYRSTEGVYYKADTKYTSGTKSSTTSAIAKTSDDALFQTLRYGAGFGYNIKLPNKAYEVTLMFAEPTYWAAGSRLFDVSVEGVKVSSSLDIYAKVGRNTAYLETHNVTLTDGELNISFANIKDNAIVSAIKVVEVDTASSSINVFSNTNANAGFMQVYPNPFTSKTTISYQLSEGADVKFSVCNVMGEVIFTSVKAYQPSGNYTIDWNAIDSKGNQLGNGLYFFKMEVDNKLVQTAKCVLIN